VGDKLKGRSYGECGPLRRVRRPRVALAGDPADPGENFKPNHDITKEVQTTNF
jgi:hypothetical protein